jgi:hypothetical protein
MSAQRPGDPYALEPESRSLAEKLNDGCVVFGCLGIVAFLVLFATWAAFNSH